MPIKLVVLAILQFLTGFINYFINLLKLNPSDVVKITYNVRAVFAPYDIVSTKEVYDRNQTPKTVPYVGVVLGCKTKGGGQVLYRVLHVNLTNVTLPVFKFYPEEELLLLFSPIGDIVRPLAEQTLASNTQTYKAGLIDSSTPFLDDSDFDIDLDKLN